MSTFKTARLARLRVDDYVLDPALMDRLMTPALVVYETKVQANLARMLDYVGSDLDRWRVHLKTTKIPEVYAMLVDTGLRAFKCATVREARCMLEVLERASVNNADLLIAYPMQGPALRRAASLARRFANTRISVLSEDVEHSRAIPSGLGVFVDVNPGMHRTGIGMDEVARIHSVVHAAGSRFRGVHFYDGHIHDATSQQRRIAAHALYQGLLELVSGLREQGIQVDEVVTSGTPTFRYALDFDGFSAGIVAGGDPGAPTRHRISPGTVVFHDYRYDELLDDLELLPAALVLTRVVSHPRQGVVTCDAGSKSVAAECGDPVAFALGHPELVGMSPSEEHLPMRAGDGVALPLGSVLHLVPRHICPTVNLAEKALLVRSDCSTMVVEVQGRAHELLLDE